MGEAMLSQCPWFGGGWSPWFVLWPLGMLVFMLLLAIIFCRRGGMCCGPWGHAGHRTPLDILKERYAKGEISKDEFDRMKRDIQD
jgi:putative membrane protein